MLERDVAEDEERVGVRRVELDRASWRATSALASSLSLSRRTRASSPWRRAFARSPSATASSLSRSSTTLVASPRAAYAWRSARDAVASVGFASSAACSARWRRPGRRAPRAGAPRGATARPSPSGVAAFAASASIAASAACASPVMLAQARQRLERAGVVGLRSRAPARRPASPARASRSARRGPARAASRSSTSRGPSPTTWACFS